MYDAFMDLQHISARTEQIKTLILLSPIRLQYITVLGLFAFQLNGKITNKIDPRSKPRDVNVIDTLTKMTEENQAFLTRFNYSGNATGYSFNATKGLGFGKKIFFTSIPLVVY